MLAFIMIFGSVPVLAYGEGDEYYGLEPVSREVEYPYQAAEPDTEAAEPYALLELFAEAEIESTTAAALEMIPASTARPMVTASYRARFALRSDGTVWGWGWNSFGQMGIAGISLLHRFPMQIQGLDNITAIDAGREHVVALRSDGTVWTWGRNNARQLGVATGNFRYTPMRVEGVDGVVAIAAGALHTVVLKSDGTVWTWGTNQMGTLGDGTTTQRSEPVQVRNLDNVVAISASGNTLALRNDGTVWSWGPNLLGTVGDGTTAFRPLPVQVINIDNIVAITSGGSHKAALRSDGTVWSWGRNTGGQIGIGTVTGVAEGLSINTPVQTHNINNVVAIGSGTNETFAITADGGLWSWGTTSDGPNRALPERVVSRELNAERNWGGPLSGNFTSVSAYGNRAVALRTDGSVAAWGADTTQVIWTFHNVLGPGGYGKLNLGTHPPLQPPSGMPPHTENYSIHLINTLATIGVETNVEGFIIRNYPFATPTAQEREAFVNSITWTVSDPAAITVGDAYWGANFQLTIPITAHREGEFILTASAPGGISAQVRIDAMAPIGDEILNALFTRSAFEYNHELAVFAAELSEQAYDLRNLTSWLERLGMTNIFPVSVEYLQYALAARTLTSPAGETQNIIFVVIRGTDSTLEWVDNLRIIPQEGFHSGFLDTYRRLMDQLNQFLDTQDVLYQNADRNIFLVTGHSRGGAIANLAAFELNNRPQLVDPQDLYTYTFASPRVTINTGTNQARYRNIFNVINRRDIVPLLPPHTQTLTWSRFGVNLSTNMTRHPNAGMPHPAHDMITYTNWLRLNEGLTVNHFNTLMERDVAARTVSRFLSWKCPVDIAIYDSQGNLAGEIIDGMAINTGEAEVVVFVSEDVKYAFLPYGGIYTVRITATDYGVLTYSIENLYDMPDAANTARSFENVTLYPGREFVSETIDTADMRLLVMEDGVVVAEVAEDGTETAVDSGNNEGGSGGSGGGARRPSGGTTPPRTASARTTDDAPEEEQDINLPTQPVSITVPADIPDGTYAVSIEGLPYGIDIPDYVEVADSEFSITLLLPIGEYNLYFTLYDSEGEAIFTSDTIHVAVETPGYAGPAEPAEPAEPTVPIAQPSTTIRLAIGEVSYTVNGVPVFGELAPFIDEATDRTMVPVRLVAEALGAQVGWIEETRTVTITQGGQFLSLTIDDPLPGGMGTAVIVNDRTFVPVSYIAQMLGAYVRWDGANRAVYIQIS